MPQWICSTCRDHAKKRQLPRAAVKNGLAFPDLPEDLVGLTPLDERMVAPIINFMQIRPLMPHSLNSQLSLKGSVINVPVEIKDMVTVLPRSFDDMNTVQIILRRHLQHKSHYMFETVRPWKIRSALEYLCQQKLYRRHNITLNEQAFRVFENDDAVYFIVDENNNNIVEEMDPIADPNETEAATSRRQLEEMCRRDIQEFFNNNENDIDEVLSIDHNYNIYNLIIFIHPL